MGYNMRRLCKRLKEKDLGELREKKGLKGVTKISQDMGEYGDPRKDTKNQKNWEKKKRGKSGTTRIPSINTSGEPQCVIKKEKNSEGEVTGSKKGKKLQPKGSV